MSGSHGFMTVGLQQILARRGMGVMTGRAAPGRRLPMMGGLKGPVPQTMTAAAQLFFSRFQQMGIFRGMGQMTDETPLFKRLVDIGLLKQLPVMAGETEDIPLFFQ